MAVSTSAYTFSGMAPGEIICVNENGRLGTRKGLDSLRQQEKREHRRVAPFILLGLYFLLKEVLKEEK